jgi:hypothetical protein
MIERRTLRKLVIRDVLGFHGGVIDEAFLLPHDGTSQGKQFTYFGRSPV